MALDPFQEQVAAIVLAAADGQAFALAGAGALSAHGLIDRPTEDVDLFSPQPGGVAQAMPAVLQALAQHGYQTQVRRTPSDHGGHFAQLVVQQGDDSVSVDMAGTGASTTRCFAPRAGPAPRRRRCQQDDRGARPRRTS